MNQADIRARPLADRSDPERFLRTDRVKADIRGHTIRGGAVTVTAEAIKQTLWFLAVVVLSRLLSPRAFGLTAMAVVVTGFIEQFSDLGLSAAVIQRDQVNQRQVSTLFWINIALGLGLALVTASLAPLVAWFYGEPRLVGIMIAAALGFIFTSLTIQHRTLLRRQMRLKPIALIDVSSTVIQISAGIAMALAGWGYWALVIMPLAGAPLEITAFWLFCRWRPNLPSRRSGVRSMLGFGGHLIGYRMIHYLIRNVDNLLIGRFYGSTQLGLYSKAYNLLIFPLQRVNNPISLVAVPALSRLTDAPERYREAFDKIVAKVCLLTMPLMAFMLSTADWLILVMLGPRWIEASRIFMWLGISGLVEPITYASLWLFLSQGRSRQQLRWGFMSGAIMVTAIVAGLPWGPIGVAVSYAIVSLCVRMPLMFWYAGREGPVSARDMYRSLAPFACTVVAVLLAVFAFRRWSGVEQPLVGLIISAAITAVVTLLTLGLLPSGRATIHDLKSIAALLRPKLVI